MGEHLSPLSLKWLRTLRNRYIEIGTGIPEDHVPKRAVSELLKAGKVWKDRLGNIVYIVQLNEKLSPMLNKWDQWRTRRGVKNTNGISEYIRFTPSQEK